MLMSRDQYIRPRLLYSKNWVIHLGGGSGTLCNNVADFKEVPKGIKIGRHVKFCSKCFPYGRPLGI